MRFNKMPWLVSMASVLLVSCSVFAPVKTEPTNTYILDVAPVVHAAKHTSRSVLVNYPRANAIVDTTQMAYSTEPFKIAYFAKNQWADTPAHMLQPLIVQTLQETHYFRQVVTPGMMGQYDYILNTELIELRQVFKASGCKVYVQLRAQWVDAASGRVIATKDFWVLEPAQPTPYGGVMATNMAVVNLLKQVAQFAMRVG